MVDFFLTSAIADFGQTATHFPHPIQSLRIENGFAWCCARFPSGGAQPIARFFNAPPNPATSCPLKWVITIMLSAATISPAIETDSKCFLVNGNMSDVFPAEPVRNDHRCPDHCVVEPVVHHGRDMVDRD